MNIEESKNLLGWVSLNKLYIDTHNECDYHNIHTAIETLLTAYEKEKEKNKELKKENKKLNLVRLQYLVSSFPDTTETYKKYKKELDELLEEE